MKKIKNKNLIYGLLIIILLILIPNSTNIYNRYTKIKVNTESYNHYETAEKIFNDSKEKIKTICHIEKNGEFEEYKLNIEYQNHKDAELINDAICNDIGDNIIVYSKYEVLQKKVELKHNDPSLIYYAQLDTLYKNQISESQFKIFFENTNHEIIYNYLLTVHTYTNKNQFKKVNIKALNAKKAMLNNYNIKLKYEIEELRFINNTIKYFTNYLNN